MVEALVWDRVMYYVPIYLLAFLYCISCMARLLVFPCCCCVYWLCMYLCYKHNIILMLLITCSVLWTDSFCYLCKSTGLAGFGLRGLGVVWVPVPRLHTRPSCCCFCVLQWVSLPGIHSDGLDSLFYYSTGLRAFDSPCWQCTLLLVWVELYSICKPN